MLLDTNFGYKAEAAYWKEDALRLQVKNYELEALRDVLTDALEKIAGPWNNQHWAREVAVEAIAAVKP